LYSGDPAARVVSEREILLDRETIFLCSAPFLRALIGFEQHQIYGGADRNLVDWMWLTMSGH